MNTVDVKSLRRGVRTSRKFKEIAKVLSRRERGRDDTSFDRIRRMLSEGGMKNVTDEELEGFFAVLEGAGAGKLVHSDETGYRFMWAFHLRSVACAALGIPEPGRFKKNGKMVKPAKGEVRPKNPPRKHYPRIDEPTRPVMMAVRRAPPTPAKPYDTSSTDTPSFEEAVTGVSVPSETLRAGDKVVSIVIGSAEFELDLAKVPSEALTFLRLV
jgi:hypothetical protein